MFNICCCLAIFAYITYILYLNIQKFKNLTPNRLVKIATSKKNVLGSEVSKETEIIYTKAPFTFSLF